MKRLIIILFTAIFCAGCTTLPPISKERRDSYEQYERDKIQRDILKELKEQNRRK